MSSGPAEGAVCAGVVTPGLIVVGAAGTVGAGLAQADSTKDTNRISIIPMPRSEVSVRLVILSLLKLFE